MICAWQSYLNILPQWMRDAVDKHGKYTLQETRLRVNMPPELITQYGSVWLERKVTTEDLSFSINVASKYSPWAAATIGNSYITAEGGHRIGICGEVVVSNHIVTGISVPSSLCIRVSRDYLGVAKSSMIQNCSVLIIGPPGSGKTTLLRDIIRKASNEFAEHVVVVDEKGELFPFINHVPCFQTGKMTDIITGCPKKHGIEAAIRNMSPQIIATDEITASEDCQALLHAGWCGVKLFSTAHAGNKSDLFKRPIYRPILDTKLFDKLIVLKPDKTWTEERMNS